MVISACSLRCRSQRMIFLQMMVASQLATVIEMRTMTNPTNSTSLMMVSLVVSTLGSQASVMVMSSATPA